MSLWNQDIDKVKAGETVRITSGFVKEFQGEKQLTTGKLGKIEVIAKVEEPAKTNEEKTEEKAEDFAVSEEAPEEDAADDDTFDEDDTEEVL